MKYLKETNIHGLIYLPESCPVKLVFGCFDKTSKNICIAINRFLNSALKRILIKLVGLFILRMAVICLCKLSLNV